MPATVSANNFELVERRESENGTDSGVFSVVTPNALPIYYGRRHASEDFTSKRGCLGVISPKLPSRRLITKGGKPNLTRSNNPLRRIAYIRDIGNTLVNSRWKWTLLCFASSYVVCWLVFAIFYMLVASDNNDSTAEEAACFYGVHGFAGYFLLSLETQQTIGYGTRYITSNCIEAVFLISLQMIISIAICGAMATIVYTKMVRPRGWSTRTLFSKIAVICQRDGELCLVFRVRDDDNKHGMGTKIKAYLVQTRMNEPRLRSLALEQSGLLIWPLEIVHKINQSSPFWDLSAKDLVTHGFELIVMMHGTSITTGQCSKTRSSYLAKEVLWGHRFKPCVKFDCEKQTYFVDHSDFNATEEVLTPLCSAQRLAEVINEISSPSSTPTYYRSPTTSHYRFTNVYHDDEESLGTSSGIGSIREERLSPTLSTIAQKLSTIREQNSIENIATIDSSTESNKNILNTKQKHMQDDGNNEEKSLGLDMESLVESLQSCLDENSNAKKNTYNFCETDF